ncbi:MAG: LPS export ABC transporter periplasmic protein LptC [Desulfotalea sp.]
MNSRNAVWLIPIILLITFPIWKIPVGNFLKPRGEINAPKPKKDKAETTNQTFEMTKMVLHRFTDSKKTAFITAEKVYTGKDENIILFDKIHADKFEKKGDDGKLIIIANFGNYNKKEELLHLKGDVNIEQTIKQQLLTSDQVIHDSANQTIYSPVATTITTPKAKITGGNFNYDIETETYKMGGRVNSELHNKVNIAN